MSVGHYIPAWIRTSAMPYPDNMPSTRSAERTYECECGHSWEVKGYYDMGSWEPINEEDEQCGNCGEWHE